MLCIVCCACAASASVFCLGCLRAAVGESKGQVVADSGMHRNNGRRCTGNNNTEKYSVCVCVGGGGG